MTIEQLTNAFITVTLIEMMVAMGLGVTFTELLRVVKDTNLVVRAALANYVGMPLAAGVLLWWSAPDPMVLAGFIILAACPGAPYGPPFAAVAKGDVPSAIGLMVLLTGSSALIAPLWIHGLLAVFSSNVPTEVNAVKICTTLLFTQLLPLCVGIGVRQWRPMLAERIRMPAMVLSKLLNMVALTLILWVQFPLLREIRLIAFLWMGLLLVMSWGIGWFCGGQGTKTRRTMMLTTSLRNVAVALVVATGSFAGTSAVTAVAAYGLLSLLATLLFAVVLGRSQASQPAMV